MDSYIHRSDVQHLLHGSLCIYHGGVVVFDPNKFDRIYCECCHDAQEYIFDLLPADENNDHDGLDIVCAKCHFVIITFHARPQSESTPIEVGI